MNSFIVNQQFHSWQQVLDAKKLYEDHSKTVLTIHKSDKLKGSSDINNRLIYARVVFKCKAGPERPTESKGYRKSSTYRKNCPVQVTILRLMHGLQKVTCVFFLIDHFSH